MAPQRRRNLLARALDDSQLALMWFPLAVTPCLKTHGQRLASRQFHPQAFRP
jgi:hypothetical protein